MASAAEHTLVASFLEQTPDLVCFKDRAHRCLAASHSLARRVGASDPAQLVGRIDADLFCPEYAARSQQLEQSVMATGLAALKRVEPLPGAAGTTTWLRTSKLPLRGAADEIIGTTTVSEDFTAAQETKLSLEQAQQELLGAFHRAGMAEVAAGVLQAVGQALSAIDRSAGVIDHRLKSSPAASLGELPDRLAIDPSAAGRLDALATQLEAERVALLAEVEQLQQHIDQIKSTVSRQQAFARVPRPGARL